MNRARFGAIRRTYLCALALTLSAFPLFSQVVERGRTYADLVSSHPCNSGNSGRLARVTDAQSSSSIGGGGGSTQVWAVCNGVDTWTLTTIGGSGGGVSGLTTADGGTALADNTIVRGDGTTGVQGSTVTVADSTGNLQWEGTTADAFEGNFTFADPTADWTWAWGAAGDLVGAGSLSIDNLKLDGNTLSSTDTNGHINLTPNGTGQIVIPLGTAAAPGLTFAGDPNTGFFSTATDALYFSTGGTNRAGINSGGLTVLGGDVFLSGTGKLTGALRVLYARTNGVGSPLVHTATTSNEIDTNEGATAEVYITLPTAAAGYVFTFIVQDTDGIRITAAAGDTIRPGTVAASSAAGYIRSATQGASITLVAINATEWVAISMNGTWTVDS